MGAELVSMGAPEQIRQCHARCAPDITGLRMLARELADGPLTPGGVLQTAQATSAIMVQARAGCRTALGLVRGGVPRSGDLPLLATRLARLEAAAGAAVAAASEGNAASLRRHLWRFDALTAAIWTVLSSVATGSRVAQARGVAAGRA